MDEVVGDTGSDSNSDVVEQKRTSILSDLKHFARKAFKRDNVIEFYCDDDTCFIASVVKKNRDVEMLGLSFENDDGVILKQVSGTFRRKTDLVAGLQVLKLNGKTISNASEAQDICDRALEGEVVSILVQGSLVKAKKRRSLFKTQKIGLSLQLEEESTDGRIIITDVDSKNGLFPMVKERSILHSVNGYIAKDFDQTLKILTSNRELTLIVLEPQQTEEGQKRQSKIEVPAKSLTKFIQIEKNNVLAIHEANTGSTDFPLRVIACIIRLNASIPIGISFHQDLQNGCLVIDSVSNKGLFANTGLAPNQKIVKINGRVTNRITQHNLDMAVQMLLSHKGRLTIEAESPGQRSGSIERRLFCIQKTSRQFQLGVGLEQVPSVNGTSCLTISKASPTMEKVLGLTQGLRLLKINGTACNPTNLPSVQGQIERSFPMLSLECLASLESNDTKNTINVKQISEPGNDNVRVIACIVRPSISVGIGFSFHPDFERGCLIIDSVSPTGLFANTGLRGNQKIVKICGHLYNRVSREKLESAVHVLRNTTGRITIEAKSLSLTPAPERQIFSIQKASKQMSLGLGLKRTKISWTITKVSPTLEKVLGLKYGLHLVKVNGFSCNHPDVSVQDLQRKMEEAFPLLSLECQLPPSDVAEGQKIEQEKEQEHQVVGEPEQDSSISISAEFATAEKALPIFVNESNKKTAKIVRTITVELKRDLVQTQLQNAKFNGILGLTLARHQHLNAIVITNISKDSLLAQSPLKIGQIFVSINHISCPYTTQSTIRMMQRKAKENDVLRIETGDVEHVDIDGFGHQNQASHAKDDRTLPPKVNEEEAKMMKAIRMGMERAIEHGNEEEEVVASEFYEGEIFDLPDPEIPDVEMEKEELDEDELLGIFSA